MKLILASQSPRRSEILKNAGYAFEVRISDTNEDINKNASPQEIVMELAKEKADAISFDTGEVILAADTIVVLDQKILGKPKDEKDAKLMLKSLSNRVHEVFTGVCIKSENKSKQFYLKTDVCFYPLCDDEILAYIKTGEPFDKAGSYGIQGRGSLLVKHICGDYFNVMGLPISKVARELKSFDILPSAKNA